MSKKPVDVDSYIAGFPAATQKLLKQVRSTIQKAAPKAEEVISYGMPGYKFHGMLVFFAGYKNHIGFYATPTGHKEFARELSVYKQGRGSVQFPINQPMPLKLISDIVKFRAAQNQERETTKTKKKVTVAKKAKPVLKKKNTAPKKTKPAAKKKSK